MDITQYPSNQVRLTDQLLLSMFSPKMSRCAPDLALTSRIPFQTFALALNCSNKAGDVEGGGRREPARQASDLPYWTSAKIQESSSILEAINQVLDSRRREIYTQSVL